MTAPRLARATRSRFVIGIAALILMIGFVAIFHSSQQELDRSREQALRCEQAQESLNSRMQTIVDNKFRLEKSLENERKEHLETKLNLKEERDIHAKALQDANIRFETLQQHYKLQQSEHADLEEDCSKAKKSQLEQINGLERKVKSLETLVTQAKTQHDKDVGDWKLKYSAVESEKNRLNDLLQSPSDHIRNNLAKQLEEYKRHCPYRLPPHTESTENSNLPNPIPLNPANSAATGGDGSVVAVKDFKEQLAIFPKPLVNGGDGSAGDNNDNNRPENMQQAAPPLKMPYKSSTSPTDIKLSEANRQAMPAASSTSEKAKRSSTHATDGHRAVKANKQLPLGVAPVPDNFEDLIKNDEKNDSGNNNNRYANVIEGLSGKNEDAEQENGAHEVKDNDFNLVDEKNEGKDHLMEVLDNAAEEDTNNFDGKGDGNNIGEGVLVAPNDGNLLDGVKKSPRSAGAANDDIHIVDSNKNAGHHGHDNDDDDKLKNEIDGDEGKEAANRHDIHDEQNEEEGDDDEYPNNPRQQEGVAVRN